MNHDSSISLCLELWTPLLSENNPGSSTSRQKVSYTTPSSDFFAVSHRSTIDVPLKDVERDIPPKQVPNGCGYNPPHNPEHNYPLQDSRSIPNRHSSQTPSVAPLPPSELFHVIYHTSPSHKVPSAYPRSRCLPLNSISVLANDDPPYNPSGSALPIPIGRPAPSISTVHTGPSSPQSRPNSQPDRKPLDDLSSWSWPGDLLTVVPLPTPKSWFDSTSSSPVVRPPDTTDPEEDLVFDLAHVRIQNNKQYNPHTVETMTLMNPLRALAPVQYRVYVSMIKTRSTYNDPAPPKSARKPRKLSKIPTRSRE